MSTVTRTLAEVITGSDPAPPDARCFFYDEPRLRAWLRTRDQVLYLADRDACPARTVTAADGTRRTWKLDRVTYPGGDLPTGELGRSVGHWNPPGQSELFEVIQGEIAVLTALAAGGPVDVLRCQEGSLVWLPHGGWHLTYVVRGPAVVTNIYSDAAHPAPGKYFRGPTIRAGLRRSGEEIVPFTARPGPAITWRQAPGSRELIGNLAGLEALITSPEVPDLLKEPQLHCRAHAGAWPGGAWHPSGS